jgi:hypothetical protein
MPSKVVMLNATGEPIAHHEERRHEALGRIIAEIKNAPFEGDYDPVDHRESNCYYVPHYTIVGAQIAEDLGIRGPDDLFGGVVPHWFLNTKAIVHDLLGAEADRPDGWDTRLAASIAPHTLPGYSAFSPKDAREAGLRLLRQGPARVKDAFAAGGLGQTVVRSVSELERALDASASGSSNSGFAVSIEANLEDIITYSIGHVYVDGISVSYWGTQRTTRDNSGAVAYGGSDLNLVRGRFEDVIPIAPTPETRLAIEAASAFDAAALKHYPGIFASRRNYDVAQGHDAQGTFHCGVIDQSWRIGGTSGVEVVAVRIFKERPDVTIIRGSSFNVYGHDAVAPASALIHYQGQDSEFGPLLMYTVVDTQ